MKIYNQEWKLVITSNEEIKKAYDEETEYKELFGLCSHKDNTIYINETMSDGRKRKTLIHEICHAIQEETGMQPFMSKTDKERLVEFMAAHYDEVGRVLKELGNI